MLKFLTISIAFQINNMVSRIVIVVEIYGTQGVKVRACDDLHDRGDELSWFSFIHK